MQSAGSVAPLYSAPEVYDLAYLGVNPREPEFFCSLARRHLAAGSRILEIAAGTGRITIPLAEAGFRVTALDKSEAMLAVLQSRASARGLGIATVVSDLACPSLDRGFDGVICALGEVSTLASLSAIAGHLRAMARIVRPLGLLAYTVPSRPNGRSPGPHSAGWNPVQSEGRVVRCEFEYQPARGEAPDPGRMAYRFDVIVEDPRGFRTYRDSGTLRVFTESFLMRLLAGVPEFRHLGWVAPCDLSLRAHPSPPDGDAGVLLLQRRES